jgi:hypothetical protein
LSAITSQSFKVSATGRDYFFYEALDQTNSRHKSGAGLLLLFWPQTSRAAETLDVYIEGSNQTYFDDAVTAGNCLITDTDGVQHEFSDTAICALEEAAQIGGFDYDAVYYTSFDSVLITRIGEDTDQYPDGSWIFWINGCLAPVGVSAYPLQAGDAIALTFEAWPEDSCRPMPTPTPSPTATPTATPTTTPKPSPIPMPTPTADENEDDDEAELPAGGEGNSEPVQPTPTPKVTPTPSRKPTSTPRVAAAVAVNPRPVSWSQPTSSPTPEVSATPTLTPTPTPKLEVGPAPEKPLGGIPLQSVDKTFALSLFGIGNAGIGLVLTRLFNKL